MEDHNDSLHYFTVYAAYFMFAFDSVVARLFIFVDHITFIYAYNV